MFSVFAVASAVLSGTEASGAPPETRRDNVTEILHGTEIVDPFRWLEDQQAPETRNWIDAQNRYTDSVLGRFAGRTVLERRLGELLKTDTIGVPQQAAGRLFFSKRRAEEQLPILYMREGHDGEDVVLVDPHPLSDDHTTSVTMLDVSPDGTLLAYGVRQGGEDEVAVKLLDVDTRQELPDQLPRARYFGVSLLPDNSGFYYSRHGAEGSRVYLHHLGSSVNDDVKIFGDAYGPGEIVYPSVSEEGKYLILHVIYGSAAKKTEIYFQDLAKNGPITPVVNDLDASFFGQAAGDRLFMRTNWNAPKGRILAVDLTNPAREHWREIIPESSAVIDDVTLAGERIVVTYLKQVRSVVKVFGADGTLETTPALPGIGSVSRVRGRWDSDEVYYSFSSFHVPPTIHRLDLARHTQDVWARVEVPLDSDRFEVKQVKYPSKDGTRVPMFLVHRRRLERDGSHPTLLTGYGGFNISLTPRFSALATTWIEHGGVFAMPNLRGGGEFGEAWHEAGMREKKQNVFDDFLAAAEWLIDRGYTRPDKLAISGGSNGGLLTGAALTQRPELFRAVVCSYPLLDMLRYHQFLVARFWVPEYGSADDPEQFRYLHAYSPYHRVQQGTEYPAVLFITGDSDTRVAPLHARKMCALLQSANGSERPILLRYDTKAGHSRAKPVSKQIEDTADVLSFLFSQLDVDLRTTSRERE